MRATSRTRGTMWTIVVALAGCFTVGGCGVTRVTVKQIDVKSESDLARVFITQGELQGPVLEDKTDDRERTIVGKARVGDVWVVLLGVRDEEAVLTSAERGDGLLFKTVRSSALLEMLRACGEAKDGLGEFEQLFANSAFACVFGLDVYEYLLFVVGNHGIEEDHLNAIVSDLDADGRVSIFIDLQDGQSYQGFIEPTPEGRKRLVPADN